MLESAGAGVPGTRRACWGGVARRSRPRQERADRL